MYKYLYITIPPYGKQKKEKKKSTRAHKTCSRKSPQGQLGPHHHFQADVMTLI